MRVALDVMGGDHAPVAVLDGAVRAVEKGYASAADIVLVGDETRIRSLLVERQKSSSFDLAGFEVVHAPEVVEMHEDPLEAMRKKRHSSIAECVRLVAADRARAVVTAGHTGAAVAAAAFGLKRLKGVRSVGLAVTFHGPTGPTTLVDVGANLKCQPIHLFQYGLMGNCFAKASLGISRPRIALLNIGSEDKKGNPLVKETHELYRRSDLNFIGNLEGQDVFGGVADVIVCEGFVGNVVLKVSEGLSEYLMGSVLRSLGSPETIHDEGAAQMYQRAVHAVRTVAARIDYAEYGGALLLGVEGLVVIGHGRSDAKAIASAIRTARRFAEANVNQAITDGLAKMAAE
jgi:glycerol-3-phosphate acyltransferase PlsX